LQAEIPIPDDAPKPPPPFLELLKKPLVAYPLPSDFSPEAEAAHLLYLWSKDRTLHSYNFSRFVHAGGSGMVFKVYVDDQTIPVAVKIARERLYSGAITNPNAAKSLSPVPPHELRALRRLSHARIVRLHDALADERGVFAITTSFVDEPQPLDQFLLRTLEQHPDPRRRKGIQPFSPARVDRACQFLVARFDEVLDAVAHMHSLDLFHCDLKPANILVGADRRATLTDLGACVDPADADTEGFLRIQFTWTYAHPELTTLVSDPRGISGGGLKASARVRVADGLARFDLFALGRTIQETLAHLEREFGERCYSAYNFRFLHTIASLLLDGHNSPLKEKIRLQDGKHFVRDVPMGYPVGLFARKRLSTAADARTRLLRFSRSYTVNDVVPELDPWQPDIINTGSEVAAPFTDRVAEVVRHPVFRRLRGELQLGWIRELYPGATHTRWSHSLGVFAAACEYYAALLADPEVPTARILLQPADIEHGILAALIHDLGQTAFAHDFEAAAPALYDHETLIHRLLDDTSWGGSPLRKILEKHWPRVDIGRMLAILQYGSESGDAGPPPLGDPVDGLARDIINGPVDADKLDYVPRDSAACRVPYGLSIDRSRFLRALTTSAREIGGTVRLALAYRAKGSAGVESLLLGRYQMYGAVYWHHTFRCIQAMFSHAVTLALPNLKGPRVVVRDDKECDLAALQRFFYMRVVCGHWIEQCRRVGFGRSLPAGFFQEPPPDLTGERALEFVWRIGSDAVRELILRLARRELFRRVFELSVGALREHGDYSALCDALSMDKRPAMGLRLGKSFLDSINKKMQQRGPIESVSESEARRRYGDLVQQSLPLVVVDFPTRGIAHERNFPHAIGDPARKYISGRSPETGTADPIFITVRGMQIRIAAIRIFAARELHELIIRYLDPQDVQDCVESTIPIIKGEQ
jgi:serine/threonine protein kinase